MGMRAPGATTQDRAAQNKGGALHADASFTGPPTSINLYGTTYCVLGANLHAAAGAGCSLSSSQHVLISYVVLLLYVESGGGESAADGTQARQLRWQIPRNGGPLHFWILSQNVASSRSHVAGSWSPHAADGGLGDGGSRLGEGGGGDASEGEGEGDEHPPQVKAHCCWTKLQ